MRTAIWILALAAVALAEIADVPWVEEEDLEDQYDDYKEEDHDRSKREAYVEGPFEEHIRVKRKCHRGSNDRMQLSADHVRTPRQIHRYEVHEHSDDASFPSPPYEQMLAASAEHHQKVYAAPPKAATTEVYVVPPTFDLHPEGSDTAKYAAPVSYSITNLAHSNQPIDVASELNVAGVPNREDLATAAGHHRANHNPYSHKFTGADGHQHHGDHYAEHGGKTSDGGNSNHYVDKGQKGFKIDEHQRKEYENAGGIKKKHHDRADHKGSYAEEAFGSRGAQFGEKKGHKKGHKSRGFHNKYHKDEFQKEHKFYDDFHKGGEHHRYGKFNARHASDESGKKKVHRVNAGHDFVKHGKKGYSNKGHVDSDHKGYSGRSGHDEHHDHHAERGRKGGKERGVHWGYAKN